MRIAVVGCGIAGATVSFLLAEQGHEVTLFEQANECQPVGAGIMLQPSGQTVLARLGIMDELEAVSARLTGMTAKLVSGKNLVSLDFTCLSSDSYALGVHRGRLFEKLFQRCQAASVNIVTSATVTGFDSSQGAILLDSEEQVSGFEFAVAADGSRSRMRKSSPISTWVREYEYGAFWITGPCEYQPGELLQIVEGTHLLTGLLPIGNGESSFFWGVPIADWPALKESDYQTWVGVIEGVFPQAVGMLQQLDGFDDMTFGTYRNVGMSRWFADGVVFIGDAAHATSPHLGQGVNLALEDAIEFAQAFEQTGSFDLACVAYSRKRHSKLRYYQQLTKFLTPFFQSRGRVRGIARDFVLPWLPRLPMIGREMLRTLSGTKNGFFR